MTDKKQTLDEWLRRLDKRPGNMSGVVDRTFAQQFAEEAAARAFEEAAAEVEVNARVRADIYGEQTLMWIARRLRARAAELRKGEG